MKIVYKIMKRLIFAFSILYGFNLMMDSLSLFIPINFYTVGAISVLGFPGLFVLVGFLMI